MNINVTLLWQMVFFVIFVWFSKKFVWSFIIDAINERKTTIADGLAAAEKGQKAEEEGLKKAEEFVAEAKSQASEIITKAEKHGSELVEESRAKARAEGERIVSAAQEEIQTELNKAREALRAQVGELAVDGARQILRREVDANAHADLLNQLAAKL
ncbi:MAG: F0F1 ATP synthase subunit B [Gammaproteobacteria bacterium]